VRFGRGQASLRDGVGVGGDEVRPGRLGVGEFDPAVQPPGIGSAFGGLSADRDPGLLPPQRLLVAGATLERDHLRVARHSIDGLPAMGSRKIGARGFHANARYVRTLTFVSSRSATAWYG
jgi:hypothetical protein